MEARTQVTIQHTWGKVYKRGLIDCGKGASCKSQGERRGDTATIL